MPHTSMAARDQAFTHRHSLHMVRTPPYNNNHHNNNNNNSLKDFCTYLICTRMRFCFAQIGALAMSAKYEEMFGIFQWKSAFSALPLFCWCDERRRRLHRSRAEIWILMITIHFVIALLGIMNFIFFFFVCLIHSESNDAPVHRFTGAHNIQREADDDRLP